MTLRVVASLSSQDKLALALTSAGSMRKLAAQLGVTHQKLGRWLREPEGPPHGVKEIPAAAAKVIGKVFAEHVKTTQERAKADGLPFSKALPIYRERRLLDTGKLGDRVFSERTQFLTRPLLDRVVAGAHKSRKFAHVSARSVVDIHSYAKAQARIEIAAGRKGITQRTLATHIANAIEGKEKRLMGEVHLRPLFTQYTPIFPGSDLRAAQSELNQKLREKHEPATGAAGTRLADQLLMQLMPQRKPRKGKK